MDRKIWKKETHMWFLNWLPPFYMLFFDISGIVYCQEWGKQCNNEISVLFSNPKDPQQTHIQDVVR